MTAEVDPPPPASRPEARPPGAGLGHRRAGGAWTAQTSGMWFRRLVDVAFVIAVVLGLVVLLVAVLGGP